MPKDSSRVRLAALAGLLSCASAWAETPATTEPAPAELSSDKPTQSLFDGLPQVDTPEARQTLLRVKVAEVERAFAATMARRDLDAFSSFISEDAVFLNGGDPLRGKAAIVAFWSKFYQGKEAPFSWEPDLVEVSRDGTLAQSNGPVRSPSGEVFARFYSTWRLEADGQWRILFDNGYATSK